MKNRPRRRRNRNRSENGKKRIDYDDDDDDDDEPGFRSITRTTTGLDTSLSCGRRGGNEDNTANDERPDPCDRCRSGIPPHPPSIAGHPSIVAPVWSTSRRSSPTSVSPRSLVLPRRRA